jgi:3-hydroxyacyl-CoA dehydrogenase
MTKRAVNIAIVGTGVIGAGWATHFLAHGFAVTAMDPGAGRRSPAEVAHVDTSGHPRLRAGHQTFALSFSHVTEY